MLAVVCEKKIKTKDSYGIYNTFTVCECLISLTVQVSRRHLLIKVQYTVKSICDRCAT